MKQSIRLSSFALGALGGAALLSAGCMKPPDLSAAKPAETEYTVENGPISVQVVESGPLEAVRTVEVKSRVSGRVAKLYVDEGDMVKAGQLIAIIDPQETELQVKQNQAQLKGAQAGSQRMAIEIEQRRVTAQTALAKARNQAAQLKLELNAQPALTTASLRTAESGLRSAEQGHELLVKVTQPNARVQAETAVTNARAGVLNAEQQYNRNKELFDLGYVAKRELEAAELNLQNAKGTLTTAQDRLQRIDDEQALERRQSEEKLAQARAEYNRTKANTVQDDLKKKQYERALQDVRDAEVALKDVQALQASRRQQQASVEQLQSVLGDSLRLLGETEIRAPVDGIVTKRLVQEGELVASLSSFSSGSPIVKVEDRGTMLAKLQINEIDVAKLSIGTPVEIKVDAIPNRKFAGRVSKIAPASIETAAGGGGSPVVKYEVEVRLDEASTALKSGMTAQCTMKVLDLPNAVRVRTEFVGREKDGRTFVLLITGPAAKGKKEPETRKVLVTVGAASGAFTEITEGVKVGDKLLKPPYTGPKRSGLMQFGPEEGGETSDSEESTGG